MLIFAIVMSIYLIFQAALDIHLMLRLQATERVVAYLALEKYEQLRREASAKRMMDGAFGGG